MVAFRCNPNPALRIGLRLLRSSIKAGDLGMDQAAHRLLPDGQPVPQQLTDFRLLSDRMEADPLA